MSLDDPSPPAPSNGEAVQSRYHGARAAVLGASGFVGRWVASALATRGAQVYLVVRDATAARKIFSQYDIHGDIFEADLEAAESVRALFQAIRPSITFNLAGYGVDPAERDEKKAYELNARLVTTICQALAETRDREWSGRDLIHVGSALEYGTIGGNLSEKSTTHATTLYGRSKLAGTYCLVRCCKARGLKGLVARLFTVYGPGEHAGRLLPALLDATGTGQPLRLTAGEQKRDFTYVEDVAEGLLRLGLASAQPGDIVNLATGRLLPVRRFVETAAGILQIPQDKLEFSAIPVRDSEMDHSDVSLERLRQLIAWVPPTNIAEGIRKTLDFGNALGDG